MTRLPTALIQMRSDTDPMRNFEQARELIQEAHRQGAQFVATPENTGLLQTDRTKMLEQIRPEADDPLLPLFCQLAGELGIHLLLGSLAIKVSDDKAANRSFVIAPSGQITARYDKIHLFDVAVNAQETWAESDHIQPGTKAVIADIGLFQLGLSICYDLRFAKLYHRLALAGAGILAVPAAFTRVTGRAHWQTLLTARAIENAAYVVAPAQGGLHEDGRRTWGHSMIIDPWGRVLAALDHDQPGVLLADLEPEKVTKARRRLPVLAQDTEFTGP